MDKTIRRRRRRRSGEAEPDELVGKELDDDDGLSPQGPCAYDVRTEGDRGGWPKSRRSKDLEWS